MSKDLGIDISALSLYLSIAALAMAVLGPLAGRLLMRFPPGNVIAAGSALLVGGTALFGMAERL
ncbi:MAG: hypothetical protein LBL01_01135, partial [Bifidobacteriaceae bacterium]|nr:hypothetical protein [Bifidobacteriaceae bacterium]